MDLTLDKLAFLWQNTVQWKRHLGKSQPPTKPRTVRLCGAGFDFGQFFGKCSESPHRANRAVTWGTFGALQTGFSPVSPWKRRCFPVPAECRSPGKWAFGCPFWKVQAHRNTAFRRVGRLPKLAYPFSWWYTSRSLMSMAFRRCFRSKPNWRYPSTQVRI